MPCHYPAFVLQYYKIVSNIEVYIREKCAVTGRCENQANQQIGWKRNAK